VGRRLHFAHLLLRAEAATFNSVLHAILSRRAFVGSLVECTKMPSASERAGLIVSRQITFRCIQNLGFSDYINAIFQEALMLCFAAQSSVETDVSFKGPLRSNAHLVD